MAAKRKRPPQAPPLKPKFLKILLPCLFHRLRIPEGFNKNIAGEIMPRKATILSPLGRPWIVELVHGDHNRFLYFGEGWQEFSHAHGLDVGYLVLFTYEGDMVFTVTIFDRSTCMKEYVVHAHGEGNEGVDGNFSSCSNVVAKKPCGRPTPEEALRERSLAEILCSTESQKHNPKVASTCREGSQFEIIISSCNPCEEPSLLLHQQFVKYSCEENGALATILSTNGKAWHIKVREDGEGFHFADGWQRFAEAHNLRIGDSLVFKHIGGLFFHVTVFNNHPSEGRCNHEVENAWIPKEEEISEKVFNSSPSEGKCNHEVENTRIPKEEEISEKVFNSSPSEGKCYLEVENARIPTEEEISEKVFNNSPSEGKCYLEVENARIPTEEEISEKVFNNSPSEGKCYLEVENARIPTEEISEKVFNSSPSEGKCYLEVENARIPTEEEISEKVFNLEVENARIPTEEEISEKGVEELAMPLSGKRVAQAILEPATTTQDGSFNMEASAEHDRCEESQDIVEGSARILHFEHVMNFSTPYRRCALTIPPKFTASNGLFKIKQLFLRDPNGRLWPVRVSHRRRNPCQLTGCAGWRDFCIGNNLRDGDMCSFHLEGENELHVKIHRRMHQKATKVSRGLEKLRVPNLSRKVATKATEPPIGQNGLVIRRKVEAHNWNRGTPNIVDWSARISHFEAAIDFSLPYRRYAFIIPAQFIASNGLSGVKQLFLRDPHAQLWPLKISYGRQCRRATAYAGWHDFCVGNNLQDGDVCLFQLKGKGELHVQISRRRHQKSMKDVSDTSCRKSERSLSRHSAAGLRKSERLLPRHSAAGMRKSERYHQVQQFTCSIPKSCYRSHHLIPSSFLPSVDLSSTGQITLIDAEARLWPVNIYHRKSRMKSRVTIGCGWKAFCIANAVEVGDECIFKLAPGSKNSDLFHVSIIKGKSVLGRVSGN